MIAQKKIIASIAAVVLTAAAFWYVNGNYRSSEDENKTKETQRTYTQITAHKAKEIMDTENDYIILDVRTQEEYSSGHMKDAVCLPNEEIVNEPDILPDKHKRFWYTAAAETGAGRRHKSWQIWDIKMFWNLAGLWTGHMRIV